MTARVSRPVRWAVAAAIMALLALPAAATSLGKAGDLARDCVAGEAALDPAGPSTVRFEVWCAVQAGEAGFSFGRDEGAPVIHFPQRVAAVGPGARGAFTCRRSGQVAKCAGRVGGPVRLEVRMALPPGRQCDLPIRVRTAGEIFAAKPVGCPGSHRERPPADIGYMRSFRKGFGLDPDLHGDRAAIGRRIHALFRAWRRGEPVARVTADELGLPLRPKDDRELEFRDEYREQTASILERWAPRHAAATFAGWDLDNERGGIFYIGFTGDQAAQLAEFKARFDLIAPGRIRPFPTPPTHSERELVALEGKVLKFFLADDSGIFNSLSIDVLANDVEVGSQQVAKARRVLAERFGGDAPIRVVREAPAVALGAALRHPGSEAD